MKTRSRQILMIVAFALAACADPTPSAPIRGQLTPAEVTGIWNISFRVDSVRECTSACAQPEADRCPCYLVGTVLRTIATGTLVVSDQHDTLYTDWLPAELRVDFSLALGRQVTCLANPQTSFVQLGDSGKAEFWFTPGAADCGLYGRAEFDGKEFHGVWGEASLLSTPLSAGTMRLWRQG